MYDPIYNVYDRLQLYYDYRKVGPRETFRTLFILHDVVNNIFEIQL